MSRQCVFGVNVERRFAIMIITNFSTPLSGGRRYERRNKNKMKKEYISVVINPSLRWLKYKMTGKKKTSFGCISCGKSFIPDQEAVKFGTTEWDGHSF